MSEFAPYAKALEAAEAYARVAERQLQDARLALDAKQEQVEIFLKSKNAWMDRAVKAEAQCATLQKELQEAQQERDEWKRRAEEAEGRIGNALA